MREHLIAHSSKRARSRCQRAATSSLDAQRWFKCDSKTWLPIFYSNVAAFWLTEQLNVAEAWVIQCSAKTSPDLVGTTAADVGDGLRGEVVHGFAPARHQCYSV